MLSLAVGSFGAGKIDGNTHLTRTGDGNNLTFKDGGEISAKDGEKTEEKTEETVEQ